MSTKIRKAKNQPRHRKTTESDTTKSLPSRIFAGGIAATLGLSGVAVGIAPASADPGYAEANAQYLSGTLLGTSLESIVEVEGVEASSEFGDTENTVEANTLSLNALDDEIIIEAPGGIQVPLYVADLGVVGQYAESSPEGNSFAATGLVGTDGTVGLAPDETTPPGPAVIDLTGLLDTEDAGLLDEAAIRAGAVTSSASQQAPDAPTGDYDIANLDITVHSPVVEGLTDDVLLAVEDVDDAVGAIAGPDGSLLDDITGALGVLGVVSDESTVSLDIALEDAVSDILDDNTILGSEDLVLIDLESGYVSFNVAELLAANGQDLNALEPGTEVLSEEIFTLLTEEIDELVNGLLDEVAATVATTLEAANLDVALDVLPALGETPPILSLTLNGTLADIASGDTEAVVSIGDTAEVNLAVAGIADGLLDLNVDTVELLEPISDLYPLLGEILPDIVSLTANVQETDEGTFTQTALRLSLLEILDGNGDALTLNLGTASVGPNALLDEPTDPDAPIVATIDPTSGSELGGTSVTITGENFTDVESVEFGTTPGNNLFVESDTQIRVTTPAGTGTVPVTLYTADPAETAVADQEFTYVPASIDDTTITDFSPVTGPEDGGTTVTIGGTNFADVEEVFFGSNPATSFTIISDTEIQAITPAGEGQVTVIVDDVVADDLFTYVTEVPDEEIPVVDEITPNTGPEEGGTDVVLDGENLESVTAVLFGDNEATNVNVVSETEIRATTPPGSGTVDVVLVSPTTPEGVSDTSFTYTPPAPLYETCADAAAAGAAPIYAGDPGYRADLDADNNGIACEEYGDTDENGDDNGSTTGDVSDDNGNNENANAVTTGAGNGTGTVNDAQVERLADTGTESGKLAIGAVILMLLGGVSLAGFSIARSRA